MSLLDTNHADKVIDEYFAWRDQQDLPPYTYMTKRQQQIAKEAQERAYESYRNNIRS